MQWLLNNNVRSFSQITGDPKRSITYCASLQMVRYVRSTIFSRVNRCISISVEPYSSYKQDNLKVTIILLRCSQWQVMLPLSSLLRMSFQVRGNAQRIPLKSARSFG